MRFYNRRIPYFVNDPKARHSKVQFVVVSNLAWIQISDQREP